MGNRLWFCSRESLVKALDSCNYSQSFISAYNLANEEAKLKRYQSVRVNRQNKSRMGSRDLRAMICFATEAPSPMSLDMQRSLTAVRESCNTL